MKREEVVCRGVSTCRLYVEVSVSGFGEVAGE
jgi:hypothetical protein